MKDILYISTLLPDYFSDNRTKTMIQYSADNMSGVFLEGLINQKDISLDVLNIQPLSPWPKQSEYFYISQNTFVRCDKVIRNVKFINAVGIRQFSKYYVLKSVFKKNGRRGYDAVIAYSVSTPVLMFLKYLKIKRNIKTCLIVPDLPSFMMTNPNHLYRTLKSIDIFFQKRLYRYIDSFILFSENMRGFFDIDDSQYQVVEGALSQKLIQSTIVEDRHKIQEETKIMYTGGVEFSNGIRELVEAIKAIKRNVKLIIVGSGRATDYVVEESKRSKSIKYLGTLSHSKVIKLQKNADILVNPRPAFEFTKYSFPSKTLEYMLSGNPTVMQKLDGIPAEYDQFLNYFTFKNMRSVLEEIIDNYPFFKMKAKLGRDFVIEEKNCDKAVKKILDLL